MIEMTIDGIPLQVDEGLTILDVARLYGFDIPTLCHLEGLTPYVACWLCGVFVLKHVNSMP
jgi:NADH dehydrogenase/NADH:ubiquinone oxidoreductase subunit G